MCVYMAFNVHLFCCQEDGGENTWNMPYSHHCDMLRHLNQNKYWSTTGVPVAFFSISHSLQLMPRFTTVVLACLLQV